MWVFLAIQVLFLIWIIAGTNSAQHANHCDQQAQLQNLCQQATDAGTAIGVGIIVVLWCVVDVILGITYLVVRSNRRNDGRAVR
jgi:hypothetical protein